MSERDLDVILAELEKTIAVLADGAAPLDELVAAHQRATGLLREGEARLRSLKARVDETAQLLAD